MRVQVRRVPVRVRRSNPYGNSSATVRLRCFYSTSKIYVSVSSLVGTSTPKVSAMSDRYDPHELELRLSHSLSAGYMNARKRSVQDM